MQLFENIWKNIWFNTTNNKLTWNFTRTQNNGLFAAFFHDRLKHQLMRRILFTSFRISKAWNLFDQDWISWNESICCNNRKQHVESLKSWFKNKLGSLARYLRHIWHGGKFASNRALTELCDIWTEATRWCVVRAWAASTVVLKSVACRVYCKKITPSSRSRIKRQRRLDLQVRISCGVGLWRRRIPFGSILEVVRYILSLEEVVLESSEAPVAVLRQRQGPVWSAFSFRGPDRLQGSDLESLDPL